MPTITNFRLGGITPLSSIDYPGELAAVLFCQGCPWRCDYCHNHHLLSRKPREKIDWQQVLDFLYKRRGLLDAVVFSGGEPTLQNGLQGAIQSVKALGYRIGLHTAGCYPKRLQKLLPLIDWVALDIKALPEYYPTLTKTRNSGEKAWASLDLLLDAGITHEIRTTRLPKQPDWEILALCDRLQDCGVQCYALQQCRTESTLNPILRMHVPRTPHPALLKRLHQQFPKFIWRR